MYVRNPDSTSEDIPPHKSHDSRLNEHLEFEVVQPHHISQYNKYKQKDGQFLTSDFERHFTNLIVCNSSRHVDQY